MGKMPDQRRPAARPAARPTDRPAGRPVAKAAPARRPAAAAKNTRPPARRAPVRKKPADREGGGISCLAALTAVLVVLIVFIITITAATFGIIAKYSRQLPELNQMVIPQAKETTKVYAAGGEVIADLYEENREYASYNEIPDGLKLAFIATEDERFFKHSGVDLKGIGRAIFLFVTTGGRRRHGASTITQQLVRNIYLTQDLRAESSMAQKLQRKFKEWLLAIAIEKRYSKEEILEHYLNVIYLGHGAHGVKTAARIFFGKNLGDLTVADSALLAAVNKGPNMYTPFVYPDRAVRRRNAVLAKMIELHFITPQEYQNSIQEDFHLAKLTGPGYENYKAPYFVTYLLDLLQDADGPFKMNYKQIYQKGYRIYTTLDMRRQRYAEEAVRYGLMMAGRRRANITQGAIVSLNPKTGAVLAMVGGVDYKQSKFNRAWQALRQPGSAFKPFVYITAIKQGRSMRTPVSDSHVCYPSFPRPYCPHNYDNKYYGDMTYTKALILSRNIPAVKVGHDVGIKNVVETAHEMGLKTPLPANLSIALGAGEVTVLDMAVAFSTIANGGFRTTPFAVERITDSTGAVVYQRKYDPGEKVLDDDVIAEIVPVMEGVVTGGTGRLSKLADRASAGKTGTTSDFRDAWFCGFVPQMTTIVWFGNDNNSPLRVMVGGRPVGAGIAGGAIPAPVWKAYMEKALKGVAPEEFQFAASTGRLHSSYSSESASETEQIENQPDGNTQETEQAGTKLIEPETLDFIENESQQQHKPRPGTSEGQDGQPQTGETGDTNYDDLF
jgi:penicillin-binding protein 1A